MNLHAPQALFLVGLLLYIAIRFANYGSTPAVVCLGIVTWLVGLWVFWRAHADLGDNWSVNLELHSVHQLVTRGAYRFVRHPMYAAFLLLGIAQALLLPNWLAGPAALVAVVFMCLVRIPNEEAMMQECFGQAYREYILRTGSVIPRIACTTKTNRNRATAILSIYSPS